MWHLYKNKQNKFEISFISKNGRYIVGSKQGYSNKRDAVNMIKLVVDGWFYQDDTKEKSVIIGVFGMTADQVYITKPYRPK